MSIKDTTKCRHCFKEFADHNYVKDSINQYKCPVPVTESCYGGFNGGNPNDFFPDPECCSEGEIKQHKEACELWNSTKAKGIEPTPEDCPSGWLGNGIHIFKCKYGLGVTSYEIESYFEEFHENESFIESDL